MSRRTAESNKAILAAWHKEQELVKEGKGTRNWTPQQQQDILEKGKAYDENGKAFEGQHMKSAEAYPEYQTDPGNIQFLTRAEHLEAHNGNWQNPTNWYYNPVTKEKFDFGDGSFIPCEIIQLHAPIINPTVKAKQEPIIKATDAPCTPLKDDNIDTKSLNTINFNIRQADGLARTAGKVFKTMIDFSMRHPILTNVAKVVGLASLAAVSGALASDSYANPGSDNHNYAPPQSGCSSLSNNHVEAPINPMSPCTSVERSSPEEHMVKGHSQHYHYKDGSVKLKEKDPYPRGGNKDA